MEGEGRQFKRDTGNGNLPPTFGVSYADTVRHIPGYLQVQERRGFLKAHVSLAMLREGFHKEGIKDCEVRLLGQRTVLLTAIGNGRLDKIVKDKEMVFAQWFGKLHPWSKQDTGISREVWLTCVAIDSDTSQQKRFDLAHFAIQTQNPEVIQLKVSIEVDEEVYFVTVAEESVQDVDWRGDVALDLRDMMGLIDNDENSKKHRGGKLLKVQGRVIRSVDSTRLNSHGTSGSTSLGFSSKAHPQTSGLEVQCYGSGDKGADLDRPIIIGKPSAGLLSPLARTSQDKVVSRLAKHAKKKQMEEIL
ncbi:hypothetical protein Ancab_006230 [Ancistrocladus abbreviatus]